MYEALIIHKLRTQRNSKHNRRVRIYFKKIPVIRRRANRLFNIQYFTMPNVGAMNLGAINTGVSSLKIKLIYFCKN